MKFVTVQVSEVRMTGKRILMALIMVLTLGAGTAWAHFGMLIPDTDGMDQDKRSVNMTLSFSHPFTPVCRRRGAALSVRACFRQKEFLTNR